MEIPPKRTVFAKKSFGQNFLVDSEYIVKIIDALELSGVETVIEIGPGRGAITKDLLEKASEVIAIELDRDMIHALDRSLGESPNLSIVQRDVLKVEFADLVKQGKPAAKLVANLPYYISTAILQRLIEQREVFSSMVLMFQREVVDRITAAPGSSERGFLTVLVEAFLRIERLFDVPPSAFKPIPKVWSTVVRLRPYPDAVAVGPGFISLISIAFSHKRKTLQNNLKNTFPAASAALHKSGIDPQRRAETLDLKEWLRLSSALAASNP